MIINMFRKKQISDFEEIIEFISQNVKRTNVYFRNTELQKDKFCGETEK